MVQFGVRVKARVERKTGKAKRKRRRRKTNLALKRLLHKHIRRERETIIALSVGKLHTW